MADASLTWLGHGSFRLDSPGGKRIYVDPWLENPKCPDAEKKPERCDVIAVTHGHDDHVGSTIELSKKFGPLPIVAMLELKGWLKANGAYQLWGVIDGQVISLGVLGARPQVAAFTASRR